MTLTARCLILLVVLLSTVRDVNAGDILVSAASSLTEVLQDIGNTYKAGHKSISLRYNFASSGALARQIEQGARVDVFVSAAPEQMNELQAQGLIDSMTRTNVSGNKIVLIVPVGSKLKSFRDLASKAVSQIAIGDPDSVPSGQYAKQTLVKLGLWSRVQPKLVLAENVRQSLIYVERRSVDAGVVFSTDLGIAKGVKKVAVAPTTSHKPVVYAAAVVKASRNPREARDFVHFLKSPAAQKIFAGHGFQKVPSIRPN